MYTFVTIKIPGISFWTVKIKLEKVPTVQKWYTLPKNLMNSQKMQMMNLKI